MQAFVQTQLVKVASTGSNANIVQTKSAKGPAGAKTTGQRFLGFLLTALSAPAV